MDGLSALAATPPRCRAEHVADAVAAQFGHRGQLEKLVSERDQNFCLTTSAGRRFLVKVASAVESPGATALQVAVLAHLEHTGDIPAPRGVRTRDGADWGLIECGGHSHRLRLLTWVEGEQLGSRGLDAAVTTSFGAALAHLDNAMSGYACSGENPVLLWDLQRVSELRPLLGRIDDRATRHSVAAAIDDYAGEVVPRLRDLRFQVIHGDANPENVICGGGEIGFIDFSDIVRAPRVFDAAIAASYLRSGGDDALALIRPFLAGYTSVAPLDHAEQCVLFDLVRARLATSITLLHWRQRERPADDEYGCKSQELESNASQFLTALDSIGRKDFLREISVLQAVGP